VHTLEISSDHFARAFGDSLKGFLDRKHISITEAAKKLGVKRGTIYTYWTDDATGNRRKPRIELLFLACVELGFEFEYNGHRISAQVLGDQKPLSVIPPGEQLEFSYSRRFNLTDDNGVVSVHLKRRQPGRVDFSVSLKAAS